MRYTVYITELAEQEIQFYFDDYNLKREGLGDHFEQEIRQGIEYLKQEAQTIQVRYKTTRIYFLKRFPFGIHFQLTGSDVLIIGVFPMRENPEKWR